MSEPKATELWQLYGARRALLHIVIATTLFMLLGAIYGFVAQPIYRSEVLLLPNSSEQDPGVGALGGGVSSLASLAGVNLEGSDSTRVEALATLTSRAFLSEFIARHELKPVLFADVWDDANSRWLEDEPTDFDAFDKFVNDVFAVREDGATQMVTLRIDWQDPDTAAAWANALATDINRVMRERTRKLAEASVAYLEREQESTVNEAVQLAISSLLEKHVTRMMMANVQPEYAFRVVDPAMPADADDPVFPQPVLLAIAAGVLGLLLSVGYIGFRTAFSRVQV